MSRVRIQELPNLPTFILRAYPEDDMPLMADFQLVCTCQQSAADEVWIHGMLGQSNRVIWRAIAGALLGRGVRYVRARRAQGRILPRGETMEDGSLRVDLHQLMQRPRDTSFSEIE
ncbi:MAG: hypothetical protein QM777_09010 [Pseudorhodoferax sp.]